MFLKFCPTIIYFYLAKYLINMHTVQIKLMYILFKNNSEGLTICEVIFTKTKLIYDILSYVVNQLVNFNHMAHNWSALHPYTVL
jgi:hypothetical protein